MPRPIVRPDAEDWLRLTLVPGLPGAAQRALLKAYGSPATVRGADRASHAKVVGDTYAASLAAGAPPALLDETLAWLSHDHHAFVALGDDHYPKALLEIADPPTLLYAIGDVPRLGGRAFAIVGSRNATQQGLADAERFAKALSDTGFTIVSGLAHGIDSAAHRGGLAGRSSSIAVVGTGLDRVYPAANRDLAHAIASQGVLLSEFALGTPPAAHNFPRRNRIISGLSLGVLVVEAAMKSGSLTTARLALEQGRDVFAIPGSIHSPLSKGCHCLIKQGAKLVESADDLLSELRSEPPPTKPIRDEAGGRHDADDVLAALGHSPASVDVLAIRCGVPASHVASELTRLELAGRVEKLPGGLFRQLAVP